VGSALGSRFLGGWAAEAGGVVAAPGLGRSSDDGVGFGVLQGKIGIGFEVDVGREAVVLLEGRKFADAPGLAFLSVVVVASSPAHWAASWILSITVVACWMP